jgi:glycerol-3-phosphate dehydrogenase
MAEQTVDKIVDFTGAAAKECVTDRTPLLPDEPQPRFSGILPPEVTREAVEHYCRNEWAVHLYDVMIRRTSWRYYHRDHLAIAERAARWMQQALSWDGERLQQELAEYRQMTVDALACGSMGHQQPATQQVQHA